MCPLFTFLVSLDIHTLQDLGVGERCLRGFGDTDLDLCDLLYRSRDLDREVLLSLDEGDLLLLLLLVTASTFGGGDFEALLLFGFSCFSTGFTVAFFVSSLSVLECWLILEALLLREELPEELLELLELDREPDRDREALELPLLLPEEELLEEKKNYAGAWTSVHRTTNLRCQLWYEATQSCPK